MRKPGELTQVLDGYRRHLEAALALGDHKTLGRQTIEDLAQRADAEAVIFLHGIELETSGWREHSENDVGPDALIAAVARRQGPFLE